MKPISEILHQCRKFVSLHANQPCQQRLRAPAPAALAALSLLGLCAGLGPVCATLYEAEDPANTFVNCGITGEKYSDDSGECVGKYGEGTYGGFTVNVTAPASGVYAMSVRVGNYADRNSRVKVNEVELSVSPIKPPVNSGGRGTFACALPLKAGINAITIYENAGAWGPHWDYIEVADSPSGAVWFINASVSTGSGTISPAGEVGVADGASQQFTMTPAFGWEVADVLVDGSSVGAVPSYTFAGVAADRTIVASFTQLPSIAGVVSGPDGPIYSAIVTLNNGSSDILTQMTNAAGEYLLVPPGNGTYFLVAKKGGCLPSAPLKAILAGAPVTGKDITLETSGSLDPLVVLDAATLSVGDDLASWPNTGTLGGSFDRDLVGPNVVANIAGKQAVEFIQPSTGDADRRTLTSAILAPAEITGASDWTICVDLYRADMQVPSGWRSYLCWSGLDNPGGEPANQGSTAAFYYTDNVAYGHWGGGAGFDSGFAKVPSGGAWHNVSITYDGTTETIYVDGIFDSSRPQALKFLADALMMVGGAHRRNDRYDDRDWRFNGAIAKLQIFDQALNAEEVAAAAGIVISTYKWVGPDHGVWSELANWNNTLPGIGNVAVFSDTGAGATVDVDAPSATAGGILFNNKVANTLIKSTANATLMLNNSSAGVTVTAAAGSHSISANIDSQSSADACDFNGPGTVILSGTNLIGRPGQHWAHGWGVSGNLEIVGGSTTVAAPEGNTANNGGISGTMVVSGGSFEAGGHDFGLTGTLTVKGAGSFTLHNGGVYDIGGGTLNIQENGTFSVERGELNDSWTVGGITTGAGWGAATSVVNQDGGTVNLPYFQPWTTGNGPGFCYGPVIPASWNPKPVQATYNLNGGVLNVSAIMCIATATGGPPLVPCEEGAAGSSAIFNFNGGTLRATQDDSAELDAIAEGSNHLMTNISHAYINGAAMIDTNDHACSINQSLEHSPDAPAIDAGLTKLGAGTLTLLQDSTYTGPTRVQAGVLACTTINSLAPTALEIDATATLDLSYPDTQTVSSLKIGGVSKPPGVYGASGSAAPIIGDSHITGIGTVTVSAMTPYSSWIAGYPSLSGANALPGADPDHDGMTNQDEFAFALNPTLGSSVNPITKQLNKTSGQFSYTRGAASGLTYTVWTSANLVAWTKDTGATQAASAPVNGAETVTVTLSGTKPLTMPKLFVRVEAQ